MAGTSKSVLGKYELLEVIGDGAEGRVYRAICVGEVRGVIIGEQVAVKRLKSTGHEKESIQFRRQIEILRKLEHPNIVSYKDSFSFREKELEEDIYCLVMELLEGETLKATVDRDRTGLHWESALIILSQTLEALRYASKNEVIHRDLKPSNIYITRAGIPKLLDFGIARMDDGESTKTTSSDGAKGTFDYMAPDFALLSGGFRGDEQSDIFSFGVLLHYTLAGALPFPPLGENATSGYYKRWLGNQPPHAEFRHPIFRVLTHARTCISKCLDPDRTARFKTFDELAVSFTEIACRKLRHGSEIYEFTGWLGKGGFGEVFQGRRVSDRCEVAIKRLFSANQSSRFVREAKILRDAAHPNLTQYVDFVEVQLREDEREYYLVLEFLDGMPDAGLRDRIKKTENGLDPGEALQIFACYLDCLDHLHNRGIIHRDIKPGNLYAPEGRPQRAKIFDLGIAHDEEGTRTHGQVPGTLDFMPPEFATQSSGRGSAQSDIYSIGVTLYQALTKSLPFPRLPDKESEAWVAFFKRAQNPPVCTFDHPVFKKIPQLVPLLRRSLAADPAKRFESAADMRDAIKIIYENFCAPAPDYEEAATAITARMPAPEAVPPPAMDPSEAATRAANLQEVERELARPAAPDPAEIERQRLAAEAAEIKRIEDERQAAEAAEKRRIEDARLAAEVAEKKRIEDERRAAVEAERQKREAAERKIREEAARKAAAETAEKKRVEDERLAAVAAEKKRIEDERRAVEEAERRKREAAERKIREEAARKAAAEAAERKQIEDERRAKLRAERAEKMRRVRKQLVKYAVIFIVAAAAVAAAYTGWNKFQYLMRERAYHHAADEANRDLQAGNFDGATAAAQRAMTIHPQDPPMQQLLEEIRKQAQLHESYTGALQNAQTALDAHDYTNALSWAKAALNKVPDDAAATKLQDSAQQDLNDYHAAIRQAGLAYPAGDYAGAQTAAEKALAFYPKDAAMLRLKSDALAAQANLEAYRAAMNLANTAFTSGDYSNAVTQVAEALRRIPNEQNALKLQAGAQTLLDNYHQQSAAAAAAFQNKDFAGALAAADKALEVYPNDMSLAGLKKNAQAQAKLRMDYDKAYKNALAAQEAHDYTNAVAWAAEALRQFGNDANAMKLRDGAQKNLDDYHSAVATAMGANAVNDFTGAMAAADKALAIYPNDAAMIQLKANAQGLMASLQAYHEALSEAQKAFDAHDYSAAVKAATLAMEKIPGDAAAQKLLSQAQQNLTSLNSLTTQAQTALDRSDFLTAISAANKAQGISKDDPTVLKIQKQALGRLDGTLVMLLDTFNVTVPTELVAARNTKASTSGALSDPDRQAFQKDVDYLEKAYRAGGCLDQNNRQPSLVDLRKVIDRWP
ncbi:MAG TPA: protein kinase [Candidatus Sulfotelmatobacter sp.]|jgi:serine/threonine protein kinase/tetratricopeptide (TPR) repeat protein|nr:protein kinase [Candidatus Sulfotelmatobacter sp.]